MHADLRGLVLTAALGTGIACATPGRATHAALSIAAPRQTGSVTAATQPEPPIIQVREYWGSPIVSIVGWAPDESAYGLRASLALDGSLIRDHRLYVNPYYIGYPPSLDQRLLAISQRSRQPQRGLVRTVIPPRELLESTRLLRDDYACFGGSCSPFERFEVRVPDALLRANRDSVAIQVYDGAREELIITIRRDLIDPYLRTVDSVTAALRWDSRTNSLETRSAPTSRSP
ncbi:MAG: hypothetical protein ACRENK_00015 [Gemmatimonadaceae bacterium]